MHTWLQNTIGPTVHKAVKSEGGGGMEFVAVVTVFSWEAVEEEGWPDVELAVGWEFDREDDEALVSVVFCAPVETQ